MNGLLLLLSLLAGGAAVAFWIKFNAANHTAKSLLDKLKNTATELDETKRALASANLTLDALRVERDYQAANPSQLNGKADNPPDQKKRRYYRKPKG
jgi:hypothetical protein